MRVSGTKLITEFFLTVGGDLGDADIDGFLNDVIYARYSVRLLVLKHALVIPRLLRQLLFS